MVHLFDGVVALSGCDKTIPGTVMALARLNLPSMMLYGGSIMPGQFQGHDVTHSRRVRSKSGNMRPAQ